MIVPRFCSDSLFRLCHMCDCTSPRDPCIHVPVHSAALLVCKCQRRCINPSRRTSLRLGSRQGIAHCCMAAPILGHPCTHMHRYIPSTHPSIHPSVHPPTHPSTHPSVSPAQSSTAQSCPVLSCPVLSCPVMSCPVLSCRGAAAQRIVSCHIIVAAPRSAPSCTNSNRAGAALVGATPKDRTSVWGLFY